MKTRVPYFALAAGCILPGALLPRALKAAPEAPLLDSATAHLASFQPLGQGFSSMGDALVGQSPEYYSLPETARDGFNDDSWSYFTVHPVDLWRYAYAGQPSWTDYTASATLKIDKAAPTHGFRGGETFFNYQWGREAVGTDAEFIVRYTDPKDYYAVRVSTGFKHIELWKTHGGVVQVKPFDFEPGTPYKLSVTASGPWLRVSVDGKKIFNYYDPVEPLLAGKVGFGVRESQTEFSGLEVVPAKADTHTAPAHHADFRVREWVGKKYIFDGDEPVAWFYQDPTAGMQLRETKLAPGLMPLLLPNIGIASFNFTPQGTLKINKEGKSLSFSASQPAKDGAFLCDSDWTLNYVAGTGYVWDKKVHFTALKDQAQMDMELEDSYFYEMVAPQTDKLPKARTAPNSCIFQRTDGKLISFPAAHHIWRDGLGDSSKAVVQNGGYAVPTVDGWGVAMQFPADNTSLYTLGFCHWGLDLHMSAQGHPASVKGQTYYGHIVYSLWNKAKVKAEYAQGSLPTPVTANPAELFNNIEPVNHFTALTPGLTGESVRCWTGNYTVDHTVGHNDTTSMRIDAKDIVHRVDAYWGDERPNIWQGPSYWTGPYLAPKYRFGIWVKADDFKGQVKLIVDSLNWPTPTKDGPHEVSLPINGKCDWTYISFESDFPRKVYNWITRIDAVGTGTVWVDDYEVTPLNQAGTVLADASGIESPAALPNGPRLAEAETK